MTKKPTTLAKERVTVAVDCDTQRLYGPLPDAAKYLLEVAAGYPGSDIHLTENWTGYEDMNMQFEYSREETDKECAARTERDRLVRQMAAEHAARSAVLRDKEKQYEKLRRELGK